MLRVTEREGRVRFAVHVQPRSSRPGIDGLHGDALRLRVSAPPVEGAANDDVIDVIAEGLHVSRRAVRIVSGATGRAKVVEVEGVTAGQVRALAV